MITITTQLGATGIRLIGRVVHNAPCQSSFVLDRAFGIEREREVSKAECIFVAKKWAASHGLRLEIAQ